MSGEGAATPSKPVEEDPADSFSTYLEYNKVVRTWFVAFGVGGPALFLVNEKTLRALNRAVAGRRPKRGLVFHTDRGSEYAATAFKDRLAELGFRQSMNRPGKMTDNAFIESFFHSMKEEIYHGLRFTDDTEIRDALNG